MTKIGLFISFILVCSFCNNKSVNSKNNTLDLDENTNTASFVTQEIFEIDFSNKYPYKNLAWEDIANIEYIALETSDDVILSSIGRVVMSENTIIISDNQQGIIFFFDERGKFLNSIKSQGGSGEEYRTLINFTVDFIRNEIFILDYFLNYKILVYSFTGEYKRSLKLTAKIWPGILYDYDNDYLICYDIYNLDDEQATSMNNRPYSLISKKSGEVVPIPIRIENRIGNRFVHYDGNVVQHSSLFIEPMIKTEKGVIISDFVLDTIYTYNNKELKPLAIRKIPAPKGMSYLSSVSIKSHNYTFFNVMRKEIDPKNKTVRALEAKCLMHNNKNKEIYELKIALSDIAGNNGILWNNYQQELPFNYILRPLPAHLLKRLDNENRIKGNLKKIVSQIKEDDNPVLVLIKLKE